jgi:iron(III) transport system substrate-binding protein
MAVAAVAASATLSACVATPDTSEDEETLASILNHTGPDREEFLYEGAKEEGKLIWYTGHTQYQLVIDAFQAAYPGIEVEATVATDTMPQRLREETASGRQGADVYEDLIAAMPRDAETFAEFSNSDDLELRDDVKPLLTPYVEPTRGTANGLQYNPDLVPADQVPTSWEDLTDPKWKGKITFGNSSVGQQLVGALLKEYGEDFLERLGHNVIVTDETTRAIADKVIAGQTTFNLVGASSHAFVAEQDGDPLIFVPLEPMSARWFGASIVKNAPHPHAAALFADWLVSDDGQALYASLGNNPVVKGPKPIPLEYLPEGDLEVIDTTQPSFWEDDDDSYEAALEDWAGLVRKYFGR